MKLAGPPQVGAVAAGGRGSFYAGGLTGDVARVAPSFWQGRITPGRVANCRAELKVEDGRDLCLLVQDGNSMTAFTTFTVADVVDGKPRTVAAWGFSGYSHPWTDAVYLPDAREVWALDGSPGVALWRAPAQGLAPVASGTMRLDADALRAVRLGPSRWLIGDGDGNLSIGEVKGHRWTRLDGAKLFKGGPDVGLWASSDHRTLFVSFTLEGELWSVPLGGGLSKAKPIRLTHVGTPCLISVNEEF